MLSVISGEVLVLVFASNDAEHKAASLQSDKKPAHSFISENPCHQCYQWYGFLLLSQEPYPPIECAMICPKERQERRRIYVVINHCGIFAVQDVVHANACRPSIAVERELALHRGVEGEKVGEAELPGAGDNLSKLVNRHKAESRSPNAGHR